MTHIFKVTLSNSDMFIHQVDWTNKTIKYSIRDKDNGKKLEPLKTSPFVTEGEMIHFDYRHITVNYLKEIDRILNLP